ncbi:SusC/RagA family TonB-linked outer membrane protein [Mucilaginibacter sp.]|uniref:SusC/RagA family TonB-linked outer membrane protein n=1 Tax=Mucilaginibacter sp. TaxID=1882438 RepID=UPI00260742BE|nr:SusC/RagA family TonB-linked outer membrane protein [Mucilaginibacter sp.]
MRMSFFMCLLAFMQASATSFAQRISLNKDNAPLRETLNDIRIQSGYSIFYDADILRNARAVNVHIKNATLSQALEQCFKGQPFSYVINKNTIVIAPKKQIETGEVHEISISGKVTDEKGETLPGVTIRLKDGSRTSIADANGNYSILIPDGKGILVYSFVGYMTQEIAVNNRTKIDIQLQSKPAALNEIIVVGYGTQKKSDLTGAVSHINMSQLQNKEALSIADYLRGSIAGLNISRSSSVTGAQSFEVRGATSIGASTQPLIVVDGMIFQGLLNDINPEDIETIDVLKDASSTAIYGSRAAAGVIILTTKKGKTDKPTINFDVKSGVSALLTKEKAYGVDDYLNMRADAMESKYATHATQREYYKDPRALKSVDLQTWLKYDGTGVPANANPMDYWLLRLNLYPGEIANYNAGKSINWVNKVFRNGTMHDYNASISGKTSNLNYYWSLGLLDNAGVVYNDNYRNVRTRINITADVTSYLQTGARVNFSSTRQDDTPAEWQLAYTNSPLGDLYDANGHYNNYPNTDIIGRNPFDKTQYNGEKRNQNIIGSLFAKVKLPFNIGYEMDYNNHWGNKSTYTYKPNYTIAALLTNGSASREEFQQYDWSVDHILHWEQTIAQKHKVNVLLLYNTAKYSSRQTDANATNFNISQALTFHDISLGGTPNVNSDDESDTRASILARLNYTYNDKYLLTASIRRDGYSAFGQSNPWANFPSLAVAWKVSEEGFMKPIDWISETKVRVSYGLSGNSGIGRYTALSQLTNGTYVRDGQTTISLYPTNMANTDLKWEQTASLNFGLDMGFFRNRITATLDMYLMTTKNLLLARTLPTLTGYTSVISNLGQLDNRGLELTIGAGLIQKPRFKWNTNFTFSFNRNKIVHLYGDKKDVLDANGNVIGQVEVDDPTNGRYIGHSLDEIYGYQIVGVWQTAEKDKAAKYGRVPGDYKTFDSNDDNKLEPLDYVWQGYTKPRFRFSQRHSLTLYNAVDISFLLSANLGNKKILDNDAINSGYSDRVSQLVKPYWTPDNQLNNWARLGYSKTGDIYTNAGFLRMDDFSIAYRFNPKLLKKAQIQNARIFLNADNVWSIDKSQYWDIETGAPTPFTLTAGISLTL